MKGWSKGMMSSTAFMTSNFVYLRRRCVYSGICWSKCVITKGGHCGNDDVDGDGGGVEDEVEVGGRVGNGPVVGEGPGDDEDGVHEGWCEDDLGLYVYCAVEVVGDGGGIAREEDRVGSEHGNEPVGVEELGKCEEGVQDGMGKYDNELLICCAR